MKSLMKHFIVILLLFVTKTYGDIQPPLEYRDSRIMGMGGAFTAVADDKNLLFYNPAGLSIVGRKRTSILDAIMDPTLWKPRYNNIGDLTVAGVGLSGSLSLFSSESMAAIKKLMEMNMLPYDKDIVDAIDGVIDTGLGGITPVTNSWGNYTYAQLKEINDAINTLQNIVISLTVDAEVLSYVRHYFGLGNFTHIDSWVQFSVEGFLPNAKGRIVADNMFVAGYGMNIPGYKRWSGGLAFKYFVRTYGKADNLNDWFALMNGIEKFNIDTSAGDKSISDYLFGGVNYTPRIENLKIGTGLGFDLGALYRYSSNWRFGLQLSDVYTRIRWWDNSESSAIPINARVGVAWTPGVSLLGVFEDPIASFDVEDVFHQQRKNFFTKLHLGTEFKILWRILTVRMGINEGYFSAGLSLDINFYLMSKIPIIGWLRPDSIYFPKFNPNDRDFLPKNPCCCLLSGALAPLTYMHIKIDASYTGKERGSYPGAIPDDQYILKVAVGYAY